LVEGGTRRRTVVSALFPLPANRVAIMGEPYRIEPFDTKERVFITAWSSNTEDARGQRLPDDIHCHATLSDAPIRHGESQVWSGVCTDGFTPRFALPKGFGVVVEAGASLLFQPMFNNRRPDSRHARMRIVMDYLTETEAKGSLKPLRGFVVSAVIPEGYFVPPRSEDRKSRVFRPPFSGRIHAIGGHLHPNGESVRLERESDGRELFTARMNRGPDLADWRLSFYSSEAGMYMSQHEALRVTGHYRNESSERADAMAGLFIFFDPDGRPGD
jgi:hypothetical protein